MPTLKQLTCHIERGSSNTPLREYSTKYGDGVVSTFVGIPSQPTTFSVHLMSSGFIAPGIAMFVYIDGEYQCNRNRRDLLRPGPDVDRQSTEVNLRVRQKEVKDGDGQFIAHAWKFEKLDIAGADKVLPTEADRRRSFGTIEVVVRRCEGGDHQYNVPESRRSGQPVRKQMTATDPPESKPELQTQRKARSDKASSFGGLGGIFDGAGDWNNAETKEWPGATAPGSADNPWALFTVPDITTQAEGVQDLNGKSSRSQRADKKSRKGSKVGSAASRKFLLPLRLSCELASSLAASPSQGLAPDEARGIVQLDGPSQMATSPPQGIVINQFVGGETDTAKAGQSRSATQLPQLSPPQHYPWQQQGPYSYPFLAPTPWQNNSQLQNDFAEFLMWKYGSGQANPQIRFAGANSPPLFAQVGSGIYTGGQPGQTTSKRDSKVGSRVQSKAGVSQLGNKYRAQASANDPGQENNDNWNFQAGDGGLNQQETNNNNADDQQNDQGWDTNNQNDQAWDTNYNNNENHNNETWDQQQPTATADPNWATTTNINNAAIPPAPKPHASSHHNTANSLLTFDPTKPYTKPYWSTWREELPSHPVPTSQTTARQASSARAQTYPPPTVKVPASIVARARLSHQLQPTAGARYTHDISRPVYIDSFEKPYAIFVFKYRSNAMLREILGHEPKEAPIERGGFRQRMMRSKKEEVVEEIMRLKKAVGYDTDDSVGSSLEEEGQASVTGSKASGKVKSEGGGQPVANGW